MVWLTCSGQAGCLRQNGVAKVPVSSMQAGCLKQSDVATVAGQQHAWKVKRPGACSHGWCEELSHHQHAVGLARSRPWEQVSATCRAQRAGLAGGAAMALNSRHCTDSSLQGCTGHQQPSFVSRWRRHPDNSAQQATYTAGSTHTGDMSR